MQDPESPRYPIGQFNHDATSSTGDTRQHLASISEFPVRLTELVGKWGDDRLDTPYRSEGWTIRQLVHHIADSHINAYVRTKLALTEDNPTIAPYEEADWAKLPDSQLDIAPSLVILRNLHQRWVTILESLAASDWGRTYFHPGSQRTVTLSEVAAHYAWHGEHHYQQAFRLAERNGWLPDLV